MGFFCVWLVCLHACASHTCMSTYAHVYIWICVCVPAHFPVLFLLVWVLRGFPVVLKMKDIMFTYTHTFIYRLATGCLPAPMQEKVECILYSSLCWAPLPAHSKSAPLNCTLISSNKGWCCNSQARRTISQALKLTNCSQSCCINKETFLNLLN